MQLVTKIWLVAHFFAANADERLLREIDEAMGTTDKLVHVVFVQELPLVLEDDALIKRKMHLGSSDHVLLLRYVALPVLAPRLLVVGHVEAGKELAVLLSKLLSSVKEIVVKTLDFRRALSVQTALYCLHVPAL